MAAVNSRSCLFKTHTVITQSLLYCCCCSTIFHRTAHGAPSVGMFGFRPVGCFSLLVVKTVSILPAINTSEPPRSPRAPGIPVTLTEHSRFCGNIDIQLTGAHGTCREILCALLLPPAASPLPLPQVLYCLLRRFPLFNPGNSTFSSSADLCTSCYTIKHVCE